jgi:hypothetical protein
MVVVGFARLLATGARCAGEQERETVSDDYKRAEIDVALAGTPEHHHLTVKIYGDEDASKHLNATPEQVRAIREILGGELLEVLSEALGDAHAYRSDDDDVFTTELRRRYRALAEAVGLKPNFDTGH